jgi:membrane protein required for colicin V production
MGTPDYIILGVICLSTAVGLWRGFIQEVFSLAIWAAAFVAAILFSDTVALKIGDAIALPSARMAAAYVGIFVAVLIVGGLINYLVGKLVEKTGLSGTDRLVGGVFGAIRGVALIITVIIIAGFTPIPNDPWWNESAAIRYLLPLADWAASLLPPNVFEYLELHPDLTAPETAAIPETAA